MNQARSQTFRRLIERLWRYWPVTILGLAAMLAMQGAELAQPWLQKVLIDRAIGGQNLSLLWPIIVSLLILTLLGQGVGAGRALAMTKFGQRAVHDLRMEVYSHLQRLSVSFFEAHPTGWVVDHVANDTTALQEFLTDTFPDLVKECLTLLWILALLLVLNWRLTLLAMLPLPLLLYGSDRFLRKAQRYWRDVVRYRSLLASLVGEVAPAARVVKAFGAEQHEVQRFEQQSAALRDSAIRAGFSGGIMAPLLGFCAMAGVTAAWGYGGYLAITHPREMSIGALVAYVQYLWRFYGPVQNMAQMARRVLWATAAAERVFALLDTSPAVTEAPHPEHRNHIEGRVTVEGVWFAYEPRKPAIQDVTFSVEPGEMVGLVGPSGAGKTTMISLLLRFFDPDQGSIRLDGVDLRELAAPSLRRQVAAVLQDTVLFSGTVGENIAYGRIDASPAEITAAARDACCEEFIERLPQGYDTPLGERGVRLSGGERQRIAIARALLMNPRVLILDEATSAVDTETEARIREALRRLVRGRTTIAIAHRLSTLRDADRLVVLDRGRVVETGTHTELLANPEGVFRRLYEQQTEQNRIIGVGG